MNVRRIIVVDRSSELPDPYLRNLDLSDSDGAGCFEGKYVISEVGYYDGTHNVDNGLLHEWGHSILHLTDQYALDIDNNLLQSSYLADIPVEWQDYWAGMRTDIGNDFMSMSSMNVGTYSSMQLSHRLENRKVHDKDRNIAETNAFPQDQVPNQVILSFGTVANNASFEVIRSCKSEDVDENGYKKKTLKKVGSLLADENGRVELNIEDVFTSSNPEVYERLLDRDEGTILLKMTDADNKIRFRWMDIRDFNIAYWKGYTESVEMQMQLIDGNSDIQKSNSDVEVPFDWTIQYGNPT